MTLEILCTNVNNYIYKSSFLVIVQSYFYIFINLVSDQKLAINGKLAILINPSLVMNYFYNL